MLKNSIIKDKAILSNLSIFIDFVNSFAEQNNISNSVLLEIALACEEIIVNIINYAYIQAVGDIELSCMYDKNSQTLQINIVDWGEKFDISNAPVPELGEPLETRKEGGLGIFLAKQFMDEVLYRRDSNCNITTLVKIIGSNIDEEQKS